MDITDIIEYFKDPSNYPVILIFLTGYVITSSLAGKSSRWKSMNQMEKLVASILLGVALDFGIVVPIIMIPLFWQGNLLLDSNFLLQQSSMYFTLFGGITTLSLHIYGAPAKKMLMFLRIIFRVVLFSSFILLVVSVGAYYQMLGYPEYLQIYMVPIWLLFVAISLVAVMLSSSIYYLTEILFITPLLKEASPIIGSIISRFPSKQPGIRKVSKLSFRDRLTLLAPFKRKIRKTAQIALLSAVLFASGLVIIPFDQAYPLLTPRLKQGTKSRYDDEILNRIILLGNQRYEEQFSFECYQMVYISYNISAPSFSGYPVRKIGIKSPSNSSKHAKVENPTSPWSWSDVDKMCVTSEDDIIFDFVESDEYHTIERIWVDWSNLTKEVFSFNITYYEVARKNVAVNASYYTENFGNQTLESYCFLVNNLEKTALIIPRIEIGRLCFSEVILNSTCIFRNGQEIHPDVTRTYVYPHCIVADHSTVNLTISFYSQC